MSPDPQPVVQMANITKTYPGGVVANDDVSLSVLSGTIHAVIGENGAGKSTLMNILYGRIQPDKGRIRIRGEDVRIASPAHAIKLGIGMVTQHTTMIPALAVIENVELGEEPGSGLAIDTSRALSRVQELGESLGISLPWTARSGTLSVAALQKAEIVKMLYRGARILVMDEPTSTLAPQETDALFSVLHTLVETGSTVIFVTHKLREVKEHSDRVTVLRGGKLSGERITSKTYPQDLLSLMIGGKTTIAGQRLTEPEELGELAGAPWERGPHSELLPETRSGLLDRELASSGPSSVPRPPMLEIKDLTVLNERRVSAVKSLTFSLTPGEVVGVAGVDGSGQKELAEAIVGLRRASKGAIFLEGEDVTRESVSGRFEGGISYIPEDRQREGLILDFSIAENMLLGRQRNRSYGGGRIMDLATVNTIGEETVVRHRVRAGGGDVLAATLSGGNQQKVVIARALDCNPRILVACQPTRGLDAEATRFVYDSFRRALAEGVAILLFSLDMDELFEMSDRIAVMYSGTLAGIRDRRSTTQEEIGKLMLEGAA